MSFKKIIKNIEITKLDNFKGIIYINNKKCFIDNVLVGDIVDIEIYKETSRYYLAKIINFIKKSENRVENLCKYPNCGGCELRYIKNDYYYQIKKDILYSKISKIFPYYKEENIEIFKVNEGKRRRISLNYQNGIYGFYEKNSNNIICIENCLNVVEEINLIIQKLKNVKLANLNFIDITKVDNGITLNFDFNNDFNINELKKIDFLKYFVILITYSIKSNPIIYYCKEKPILKLKNKEIILPEKCFLQATKESQDFMINVVCDNLKDCKKVVDLYCGTGTYTFPLSENSKVFCYEGEELMTNSIKNNSFKTSINAIKRDLFNQPLTDNELNEFDGMVINPPRNGAENQCKFIAKSKVNKVIYISCNLDAFIRDTKLFSDKYKLEKLYLVDQFYMSKHFEIIGVFI